MMIDNHGRSWYFEQLEILHFSSKQAESLKRQIMNSVEQLVLDHAFCSSFQNNFDNYAIEQTLTIASNISSLLEQQQRKAGDLYYPTHLELFAEQFIDKFDVKTCKSKMECNKRLSTELQEALTEEFNYQ